MRHRPKDGRRLPRAAFGFGLASIFTPCVFPMIPITMSYFVNKQGSLRQAVIFCLGIIVLFSGIGLLVTAALGPVGSLRWDKAPGSTVSSRCCLWYSD